MVPMQCTHLLQLKHLQFLQLLLPKRLLQRPLLPLQQPPLRQRASN
jgi:hypothetical protein